MEQSTRRVKKGSIEADKMMGKRGGRRIRRKSNGAIIIILYWFINVSLIYGMHLEDSIVQLYKENVLKCKGRKDF